MDVSDFSLFYIVPSVVLASFLVPFNDTINDTRQINPFIVIYTVHYPHTGSPYEPYLDGQ